MIKKVFGNKKLLLAIIAGFLVLVLIIGGTISSHNKQKEKEKSEAEARERMEQEEADMLNNSDFLLINKQEDLRKKYGALPEGYIWDFDGSLLSLGDKSMSAEEVLYAYLNGVKTLDFSSVQKFSRNSMVVETYSEYFNESARYNDYKESFMRNMYRSCMLSIQTDKVISNTVFAENKQVFTIKVSMLDLTTKDFWQKDKETIYKNLQLYKKDEADDTKGDIYLYDYINRYYSSEDAARRDVTFDITLERYADLDTGWLVSIDTDVDAACRYADGTLVVQYIKECFASEAYDYFNK